MNNLSCPDQPSLSVIIPTYNRSELVRECLMALQSCGVKPIEAIVADDGSTDDTAEMIKRIDPRTRYIWQPNSGTPSTARNKGFSICHGKYIAFVDCDDRWLPGAAAQVVRLLDTYPEVDVLFTDAQMGNDREGYCSWIEIAGEAAFFKLPCKQPETGFRIFSRQPFFQRMAVRNPVFISAVILRREAFERSGMFDPELRGAADWELWLRMASTMTFGYCAEPLSIYTRHLDSNANMSNDHDGMRQEFIWALEKVLAKCPHLPQEDTTLLRRQLRHHLFGHAYAAYNRGEIPLAHRRFSELRRKMGLKPVELAYLFACALPAPILARLRNIKHIMGKQA
jgi:glycosyltransferase involved in cell wall biosynthesis